MTTVNPSNLPIPIFLKSYFPMTGEKLITKLMPSFAALNKGQIDRIRQKPPDPRYSFATAQLRSVHNRNRYMDIIPFESSRVHLVATMVRSKASPTASYINASHIVLKQRGISRKYIASQGPLDSTCGDFWLMVLEQRCRVIVCLTRVEEGGMSKCARYWPEVEGQELLFQTTEGGVRIRVRCTAPMKLNERADCEVRTIRVERVDLPDQEGGFEVTQLCFFGWPDHAVPERPGHVLELIRVMRETEKSYQVEGEIGPTVVHCSAGCGRTGTFCTIDAAWAMLEAKAATWKDEEDDGRDWVYEIVNALREQRVTMVQAVPQYMFCCNALWELVGGEARVGSV
ncbi:protein-tyrosine phosphatase-like protein [Endogone sp. FLAS-F59071]|nr:protein-tyrosine phosphatase-like protein [Endogone sp. FLAS-F59071]|eukprot:RUS12737.1 protein-tyrosine phosphatase-like protein [Endogone sp. FLAS-F59071]